MDQVGLIGVDGDLASRLADAVGGAEHLVRCSSDGLGGALPSALVLGPELSTEDALSMTRVLDSTRPDVGVIIVAEPDPAMLRAALQAGARDVWSPTVDIPELETSLAKVFVAAQGRREYIARRASPDTGVVSRSARSVIVTVSPKGGAGKTMVSTNLAVGIAQATDQPVVLVDLDMQFGDVGTALGLNPEKTIADAVPISRNLPALKTMLTPHRSGLHVLCATTEPVDAERVTPADARAIIETLQGDFATTIVDTAAGLDEYTLQALELATDLVLVSTTDIFAINGTRKLLDVLEAIDIGEPDRHLVLNRANARVNITRAQIESTLNAQVDVEVPSTRAVPMAMNRGESIYSAGRVARRPMMELLGRFVDLKDAKDHIR